MTRWGVSSAGGAGRWDRPGAWLRREGSGCGDAPAALGRRGRGTAAAGAVSGCASWLGNVHGSSGSPPQGFLESLWPEEPQFLQLPQGTAHHQDDEEGNGVSGPRGGGCAGLGAVGRARALWRWCAVLAGVGRALCARWLPPAPSALDFRERWLFLLSAQFKTPQARLLGRPSRGCGGAEVPPCLSCSHRQREKIPSKATCSQAAEGSLRRFMCRNPTFGRFCVNCVQTSLEKFPCSSWESSGWSPRGAGAAPAPRHGRNLEIRALSFLLHHLIAA